MVLPKACTGLKPGGTPAKKVWRISFIPDTGGGGGASRRDGSVSLWETSRFSLTRKLPPTSQTYVFYCRCRCGHVPRRGAYL